MPDETPLDLASIGGGLAGLILDGIGALSWAYALMARTIMSHIRGTARLDMEQHPRLNHLDIARHLAERDPAGHGQGPVWDFYRDLALRIPDDGRTRSRETRP